uniref:B30.2/SPRY domain-containing protein n=1 Tax=Periophthalmus magnuspinnatus TaxID=409849 RepID=A0A3B4AAJ8_9GOBI
MQQRFSRVFEGVAKAGDSAPLTQIYTELYITEGGASEVNQEHEVRHMETASRRPASPETTITCEDLFKARPHSPEPIRAVLTKGVAGVGKTVLTQKFCLDWAEGRANQDLQLLFPFAFRELNVLRDTQFSLVGLMHHFFSSSKSLCNFQQLQVLFIFDGLDECRLPLDFNQAPVLTDPTESSTSVHVAGEHLIRGSLLPFAHLWITTRPAAANQIPAEFVFMVTEVRGFTDSKKEQYFRKRFRDQATAVISHIKSIRSLHIMSHIPVFCWILSTVIQKLLEQTEQPELPQTLTQMYIHFLVFQAKVQEMVRSLGKLAFEQLQKGNLIFYESDLSECGLDTAVASVYSGVFTQVFREEPGLYQDKVYCFIHLSVQEFLAALHVHQIFTESGVNLLGVQQTSFLPQLFKNKTELKLLYRSAVDQALQSPNGHLDLFLRFLLGLTIPINQSLLQGLLTQTGSDRTNQETRSLNLLHCLNELNEHSLVKEIQEYMRRGQISWLNSPALWSALSFLLLSSDSNLEEFDLRKYQASETALLVQTIFKLLSVVLCHNDLQDSGVELLCSGLKSATSKLETLRGCHLSCTCLWCSSVSFSAYSWICALSDRISDCSVVSGLIQKKTPVLKSGVLPARVNMSVVLSPYVHMSIILCVFRLSGCLVSERGGAALASVLSSASSHLRALDLSYNHPGPLAELLTTLRDDPHCPLQSLRMDPAGEQWMVPGLRKYSCEFSLDPNTAHSKLKLSEDKRTVTCVTVTCVREEQQYPDHEDRFTHYYQVLSCTGLRGRCYWEVQWSGWDIKISVSYRGIRRRGERKESKFGGNDQSWSLRVLYGRYSFYHNNRETDLSSSFSSSSAGSLSFYDVRSDGELFHLHTFSSSFTEPLFPGFGVMFEGSSVSVVDLRRAPLGGHM